MIREKIKNRARNLRRQGKSYSEIQKKLNLNIPKSTLSFWFKDIKLSAKDRKLLDRNIKNNIIRAQKIAVKNIAEKRKKYLDSLINDNFYLVDLAKNKNNAKLMLTMLYMGEGSKNRKGSMVFGNSNPHIIDVFLKLLRSCYKIDENKFRCTLQCRADQPIEQLENFWSELTKIPRNQFYKAQIDKRTIGKPSKKKDYKGVCRIDCFSATVYNELMVIAELLTKNI